MSITAAEFDDRHAGYGDDITTYDADGRMGSQHACRCGSPLNKGLGIQYALQAHRAEELEKYVQERMAVAVDAHKATLHRLEIMVAREMELHDTPMHIQANLDQIVTEAWVDLGVTHPHQEADPESAPGTPGTISL